MKKNEHNKTIAERQAAFDKSLAARMNGADSDAVRFANAHATVQRVLMRRRQQGR